MEGGSSGNDNGTTQPVSSQNVTVSGTVSTIQGQSISSLALNNPINVIAIDNDFNMQKTATDQNGKFSLKLEKGKNYAFLFQGTDGTFLGTLIINNYSGLQIDGDLDLGTITINKNTKVATTDKEQELASKVSQQLDIKKPEDIKIDPTKTKKIDLTLFISNEKGWGSYGFDNNEKYEFTVSKTVPRNNHSIEVTYSFQEYKTNSNGGNCTLPNDMFDSKCYDIIEYKRRIFYGDKYKEPSVCKRRKSNNGNFSWKEENLNFEIPYVLEIGHTFKIQNEGELINVSLEKVGTTNINGKNLDVALLKLNDSYLWLIKGYGGLASTSNTDFSNPQWIYDTNDSLNAVGFAYYIMNKDNDVLYIYKNIPNFPQNANLEFKTLIDNLPDPFANTPSVCNSVVN